MVNVLVRFSLLCLISTMAMSFQAPAGQATAGTDSTFLDTMAADSLPADSLAQADSSSYGRLEPIDFYERPAHAVPLRNNPYPGGWFFLLNCGLLLLMAVKLAAFPQYAKKSWNALINENLFFQMIREKSPLSTALVVLELILRLYVFACIVVIFLTMLLPGYSFSAGGIGRVFLLLAAFTAVKSAVTYLIAALTDHMEFYKVLNLSHIVVTSYMSLLLVPLIMLVMYLSSPWYQYGVYVVLTCFFLGIIALIFRALRISLKVRSVVNLQFFLYLCAFEVMPYLFMAKVFERSILNQ